MKVGIIDYGVGNLGSIARALEQLRVSPVLVDRAIDIHANDALILPGVGNFTDCMQILRQGGWVNAIKEEVNNYNRPLLGICLGMQLLANFGLEGALDSTIGTEGLGLIPGRVVSLTSQGCSLRVPHVGWNSITKLDSKPWVLDGISNGTDFYFVHSYVFIADEQKTVLAKAEYDISFTAVVGLGRVWGTQFHPEKSSRAGMQLLRNFIYSQRC
ncbi:imidazole glycerol phosphate synthase subunit HisH [Sphaerospermopsis kisseleviana CS-549]|uniref:Imidazole glycerol phosphate synthase subunit HisH n=1 Tax=Sphaerospermopsis kisseleviana CS-549 TaxID=3021783 RepID=A0ABT4ZM67_9CYAN|nr:imidazole glycerol phosphate synthase subunit HisH [Sphaerospermopsis kisseleviana]MDB9440184.1 imidazole glycerol phosphate synthase subunit HisH [Sphaerospermopsis kisseleviana CS-549]BAZ82359.1 imidazoleglycerol-phosphate synthase, glutamine amidotransferase subunit [Sphaerospermopsis kisseleviana NIES-73]